MQVLKTTSPLVASAIGAPKSRPSNVAPDSSARRPRTSGTGHHPRLHRYTLGVLVDDAATGDGEQNAAPQPAAEQRRVARPGLPSSLADSPLGRRVEQRARRCLTDAQ